MDNYEASASDCTTTFPPIRSSRRHRKPRPRNSPYYKRLLASHKKRRRKEIIEYEQPNLSSSDEWEPPSPFAESGVPNPQFLRYMPRPSDIVPAIDDGSASDAGFDDKERQIHKRRVEAIRILLTSIGPKGVIRPVERWKRNRHALSKYTPFMNPPKEDANLPDLRVPPPLLSRFYRGTLLTVHRPGTAKTPPKQENVEVCSPQASAFECECLGSSSRSDFETAEPRIYVKSEPVEDGEEDGFPAAPGDSEGDAARDPTTFSKEVFLEELGIIAGGSGDEISDEELKRLGSSGANKRNRSSESEGEGKAHAPAKPKGQKDHESASDNEVQEISKPEKRSEFDLFRQMLSQNPDVLFEEPKVQDDEPCIVKQLDANGEVAAQELEDCTELTEFERDKRVAMLFSNNSSKRSQSVAQDLSAKYFNPSKRRRLGESFEQSGQAAKSGTKDSRFKLNYGLKVMNKMGFTGRLGKQEDGRKDPVLPTRHSFRRGLGSCSVQVDARSGNGSLLPTKFQGKSVRSRAATGDTETSSPAQMNRVSKNAVVPVNSHHRASEGADLYTRRRKKTISHPKGRNHEDTAAAGLPQRSSLPETQKSRQLDEDDIYETEDEDDGIDNGRRAILIDIDALIKGSAQRRFDAIEKVLKDASLVLNLRKFFANEARDLCEAELLRLVLGHANVKPHKMDDFKEKLDEAFESLPCPELDMELIDMLRQYARNLHFGIFHRGSRRRLQYDLEKAGLMESFLQEVCTTVKYEEKWPYIHTWQDLTSRVGVAARQCVYLLNDSRVVKCRSVWRPSSGVLAGSCLGAQTAVLEQLEDGMKLRIRSPMRKGRTVKIDGSSTFSGRKKFFDELLKNRIPVLKRRRVLAQYADDLLWYSAVVQYEGGKDGKCCVKFHKFENTDWIPDEELVELPRRDFRKMEKLEFPGLIDSDVSVL